MFMWVKILVSLRASINVMHFSHDDQQENKDSDTRGYVSRLLTLDFSLRADAKSKAVQLNTATGTFEVERD